MAETNYNERNSSIETKRARVNKNRMDIHVFKFVSKIKMRKKREIISNDRPLERGEPGVGYSMFVSTEQSC